MRNMKKILLSTLMASLSGSMIFAAGNVTQYDNVLKVKDSGLSKSQIIIYADDDDTVIIKPSNSGNGDNRPLVKPVKPEVKPSKPEVKPVKPEVKPVKPEKVETKPCKPEVKKDKNKELKRRQRKGYKHDKSGVWPSKESGTTKPVLPPKVSKDKKDNRPIVVPVEVSVKPVKVEPKTVKENNGKGNNGKGNKYGHYKNKKNQLDDEFIEFIFESRGK